MRDLIIVILLGIVEGITEFLPISSTGHLLLCERWMGVDLHDPFWKLFTVFIQIGAILAVVVYFRERIIGMLRSWRTGSQPTLLDVSVEPNGRPSMAMNRRRLSPIWLILIATIPALAVGKLANDWVDKHMETPLIIALALGIGGLVMAVIELFKIKPKTLHLEDINPSQAIIIGLSQILAILFPGTSRSAATIMPGLVVGLSRKAAAEFSFFLAIPAMFAACGYKLLKERSHLDGKQIMLLTVGTLVSFLVAWIVIAGFMTFIRVRSFMVFAIYRIILAATVLWALK